MSYVKFVSILLIQVCLVVCQQDAKVTYDAVDNGVSVLTSVKKMDIKKLQKDIKDIATL